MIFQYLAQLTNPVLPPTLGTGNTAQGGLIVGRFISALIGVIIIVSFIISFFYLLTGAVFWITSGGDKENLQTARRRIIQALLGLIVVSATWAIMTLVGDFLGLNFESLPIPTVNQSSPGGGPLPGGGGGGGIPGRVL